MNKISHSSINRYLTCPKSYKLHYIEKIRPKALKSALIFGGALDKGLNVLLSHKPLQEAKEAFKKAWETTYYNNELINLQKDQRVIYSKSDIDEDLLKHFNSSHENKGWYSLLLKGYLMLEAYQAEIIPQFSLIWDVQKPISLKNSEGDEVMGFVDFKAVFNGKKVLFDNKSSSIKYAPDSPNNSQQLVLYSYVENDCDQIGFVVMNKKINKQKKKICSKCGFDGSHTRHTSCNNEINNIRCKSSFIETINPKCDIEIITNVVQLSDEERVLNDTDKANSGIRNKQFNPNYSSCEGKFGRCEYWSLCHETSMEGLTVLKK